MKAALIILCGVFVLTLSFPSKVEWSYLLRVFSSMDGPLPRLDR